MGGWSWGGGTYLAGAGSDGLANLWDTHTGSKSVQWTSAVDCRQHAARPLSAEGVIRRSWQQVEALEAASIQRSTVGVWASQVMFLGFVQGPGWAFRLLSNAAPIIGMRSQPPAFPPCTQRKNLMTCSSSVPLLQSSLPKAPTPTPPLQGHPTLLDCHAVPTGVCKFT